MAIQTHTATDGTVRTYDTETGAWTTIAGPTMATYDSPSDEKPLPQSFYDNLHAIPTRGGSYSAQQQWAFRDFQQQFGRNPTASELATLAPSYATDSDNLINFGGGKSQVAAYYQQLSQTPTNIYKKQQSDLQAKAPQYYNTVNQTFQSQLGRDATDAEKTHFGMLLASGQDPYEIQQALQQTPEYETTATQKFSDTLKTQLQQSNVDYYSKYIMPAIQANNAMAGRTQDSSGYQAQLASAAQQQNYNLNDYLAQVQAGGYQNAMTNNAGNYSALLGQQYGLQNANISNQLANNSANTQYNQNLNMYQLQQQSYNDYLNRYGKRNQGQSVLQGGLSGAMAGGSATASPWGALAGGVFGAAGGYYASM